MTVYVENEIETEFPFDPLEVASQVAEAALDAEGCPYETEINVLITDDEGIRVYNREYRGIDSATDVLSFPNVPFETPADFSAAEESDRRAQKALQEAKNYFRPELMGRMDEVVLFDPLGPEQLTHIADRLLGELEQRAAVQGYTLHHTPAAAAALAGRETPVYGARELRRKVGRAVEQALADRIASGDTMPGASFTADVDPDGQIVLRSGDFAACV